MAPNPCGVIDESLAVKELVVFVGVQVLNRHFVSVLRVVCHVEDVLLPLVGRLVPADQPHMDQENGAFEPHERH